MKEKRRFKTRLQKAELIKAIEGSSGIIATIAKRCNCSWHTAQNAIFTIPEAKTVYLDEVEKVLDFAENTILKSIIDGDVKTAKWYLMNKGKKRGYGENPEIENENNDEVTTLIIDNGKPLDVIELSEENEHKDE